jgi:16S rRNA pseudouridine516 synthase
MKLSRIVSNQPDISRKKANWLIATGQVHVNDLICRMTDTDVDEFAVVSVNGKMVRQGHCARYLMLNKPAGYLSATEDDTHPTVLQLLPPALGQGLHIAGRLDRATTGLMILTNNGTWSRQLTLPGMGIAKVYRVTTAYPIGPDTARRFAEGIWFEYEQLTTAPAALELLEPTLARLTIYEGRYHQVKRMFHAAGNRVVALHREQIGHLQLNRDLTEGNFRMLTGSEIEGLNRYYT